MVEIIQRITRRFLIACASGSKPQRDEGEASRRGGVHEPVLARRASSGEREPAEAATTAAILSARFAASSCLQQARRGREGWAAAPSSEPATALTKGAPHHTVAGLRRSSASCSARMAGNDGGGPPVTLAGPHLAAPHATARTSSLASSSALGSRTNSRIGMDCRAASVGGCPASGVGRALLAALAVPGTGIDNGTGRLCSSFRICDSGGGAGDSEMPHPPPLHAPRPPPAAPRPLPQPMAWSCNPACHGPCRNCRMDTPLPVLEGASLGESSEVEPPVTGECGSCGGGGCCCC